MRNKLYLIISSFFILTFGCRNKSNYNNLDQSENHNNVLKIDKYEIKFPNISFDDNKIIPYNLSTFECFPKLESAIFN